MRIYHYPLQPGVNTIVMPWGANVVSVGLRDEALAVWAMVNPNEKAVVHREFYVAMTGEDIPERFTLYVGRVQKGWVQAHVLLKPWSDDR